MDMHRLYDFMQWQVVNGKPIVINGKIITPQAQSVTVRWLNGGWVWNRPMVVLVEEDSHTQHLPIQDVTRITQLVLLGLAFSFLLFTFLQFLRQRSQNETKHSAE